MAEDDKVAVITGASSGIGYATALCMAKRGYHLVLAARRERQLQEVAAQCEEEGVRTATVVADVANEKAVAQIAITAIDEFGHFDVWVNNAGVYLTGKFEDTPIADIKRLMDINFYGYVYGSRMALSQFREQGYGTLINISSINAPAPQPYVGVYGASKAAIRDLDEALRMELQLEGLKNIHVCTVMPASLDTNLFQNGANYTGQKVRALEPVYDPMYAAKLIARLSDHPKRELKIGPAGRMMALQRTHMPRSYEKRIGKFTQNDLLDPEETAGATKGNLYNPIEENTGIYGGWRDTRLRADRLNEGLGIGLLVAAGLAGLGLYLAKRATNK